MTAELEAELARARQRLARGEDPHQVLESFARGFTNKLLHPAIEALKAVQRSAREQP